MGQASLGRPARRCASRQDGRAFWSKRQSARLAPGAQGVAGCSIPQLLAGLAGRRLLRSRPSAVLRSGGQPGPPPFAPCAGPRCPRATPTLHLACCPAGKPTGEAYVQLDTAEEAARAMKERQHENMGTRYIE